MLILAGLVVVVATVAHRLSAPAATAVGTVWLGEPAGTRVAALVPAGDRLAVLLQGGGADRIVLVDPQDGSRLGTVSVAGPAVPGH